MPLTLRAILCAVDFSPSSSLVIDYGVFIAKRLGVRLYLVHAIHDPQDGAHPTAVFERGGDLTQSSAAARAQMEELMADVPMAWEAVIRHGDPVEETVAFADSLPMSLVIAASHGVSPFRRLFIGTVVERLSRALTCPMLVVKPGSSVQAEGFDGFHALLVSCDEHGHWYRLAPLLASLCSHRAFRVHLVHTIERPVDVVELDQETAPYDQAQQKLQARMEGILTKQGGQWFPTAHALSIGVAPGVPQEMVLNDATEMGSDLIVVGVRASGKVGRWFSGSTTEALLRQAPCDVLVFPETLPGGHRGESQ